MTTIPRPRAARARGYIRWTAPFAGALSIVLAHPISVLATDITTCGTTVAAGDTAILQADLDCASHHFGIRLLPGSTLQLNGHAIAGGMVTFATVLGVEAIDDADPGEGGRGDFTLVGPGEISGVVNPPFASTGTQACVTLQDGRAVISSPTGSIDIHHCAFGIVGYIPEYSTNRARATIDHVILHDNVFEGVTVRRLVASDVTSYNNLGIGVHAGSKLVANNVVAYDNMSQGLFAVHRLEGTNVTATGNGIGVGSFGSIVLTNLVATDNTYSYGVQAKRVRLTDSTVTGNPQADISSRAKPKLVSTTCGTSIRYPDQTSWGVCAND